MLLAEDAHVLIMLKRDSNLIASILGVLKAGCAYVPIDPEYPQERINYIYENSQADYIISYETSDNSINVNELLEEGIAEIKAMKAKQEAETVERVEAEVVAEEATRVGAYYINRRWLGGMLTNFETIRGRVNKLRELEDFIASGHAEKLPKKEQAQLNRQLDKLSKTLGGIKEMRGLPDIIFVVDQAKEDIAIAEANKLNIPVICLADTNANPDGINYVIPGNDDAIRAVKLIVECIANAVLEAKQGESMAAAVEEDEAADAE